VLRCCSTVCEVWSWLPSPLCSDANQNSPAPLNASNLLHCTSLQLQLPYSIRSKPIVHRVYQNFEIMVSPTNSNCTLYIQRYERLYRQSSRPAARFGNSRSESLEYVNALKSNTSVPFLDVEDVNKLLYRKKEKFIIKQDNAGVV
jgi:hypothetical protein